jgi:hypothetical protein
LRECDNRLEGSKWTMEKTGDTEDLYSACFTKYYLGNHREMQARRKRKRLGRPKHRWINRRGEGGDHRIQKNNKIGE